MSCAVLRADARHLPLPDASVDLIVTSPPYFGLRSYTDAGEHYGGQIGSEATPREWLAAMLECTAEWVRVLKPSGSIFVNLGDKYASGPGGWSGGHSGGRLNGRVGEGVLQKGYRRRATPETPTKSLLGLPWRYALACMDDLGLILRRDIIWSKPNGLPESVTDRCRSSHEYLFHLVKQPRYYAAVDEIRQASQIVFTAPQNGTAHHGRAMAAGEGHHRYDTRTNNPLGKLPGSVWDIPSQPLTVPAHLGVDHFAAFPMELPRRIILGWSPPGICVACGEGRRPVVDRGSLDMEQAGAITARRKTNPRAGTEAEGQGRRAGAASMTSLRLNAEEYRRLRSPDQITGYACACPDATAPTRPAVVADPFGGTGTTALVAAMYGRLGLSFDLSADYCRLARWRTRDPAQRAQAMQVPKPPSVPDGQGDLFDGLELAP